MSVRRLSPILSGILLTASLALAGCVAPPTGAAQTASGEDFNDPFEETNRAIFRFNQAVDEAVLLPAARAYRTVVPPPARQSLHDFLQNLNGPVIFANDVFQGHPELAANTFARLAINTTVGVGGMFDVATLAGIPYHSNDMGVTLATWGFAEGPYVVAPVLGPSNPRDGIGMGVDQFISPYGYLMDEGPANWFGLSRFVLDGIDTRASVLDELDSIERSSVDFYAQIRSLWRQKRAKDLNNGIPPPLKPDDELYEDPGAK